MFTDILWRFLMIETFVIGALCCRCVYKHPQKHFCKHDYVLKVNILEVINVIGAKAFTMELKEVFKGDVRELIVIQKLSVILEMPPDCPIDSMKTGDTYLIFGDYQNGYIYTTKCYGNVLWEKTTLFQREALAKYYKRNCDCSPEAKDTTIQRRCKSKYSFLRKSSTNCKWVKTRYFQLCEMGYLNGTFWK